MVGSLYKHLYNAKTRVKYSDCFFNHLKSNSNEDLKYYIDNHFKETDLIDYDKYHFNQIRESKMTKMSR